ncbi:MAG: hypothetical protein WCH11_01450 [Bdellovibrio sp.]
MIFLIQRCWSVLLIILVLGGCKSDEFPQAWVGFYSGLLDSNSVHAELQILKRNTLELLIRDSNRLIRMSAEKVSRNVVVNGWIEEVPKLEMVSENCYQAQMKNQHWSLCWGDTISLVTEDLEKKRITHRLDLKRNGEVIRSEKPETLQLSQVLSFAWERNFTSRIEWEKSRQALARLKQAYGNLAPHATINTFAAAKIYSQFLGALNMVADLLPFFWPNRWMEAGALDAERRAQINAETIVRFNSLMDVEMIALSLLRDQSLVDLLRSQIGEIQILENQVQTLEKLGFYQPGTSDSLSGLRNALQLNLQGIEDVMDEVYFSLSVGAGFYSPHAITRVVDDGEDLIRTADLIEEDRLVGEALSSSPELSQIKNLIQAAKSRKSAVRWSFLDPGGDPSSSLGLGFGPSLELKQSEIRELERRADAAEAFLREQAVASWQNQSHLRLRYSIAQEGEKIQKSRTSRLLSYLKSGEAVDLFEIAEALANKAEIQMELISVGFQYRMLHARIRRLRLIRPLS